MNISIIICTFNRYQKLEKVLLSLCNQALDVCFFEIIVVDNNSTDETFDVVKRIQRNTNKVCYYFEGNQGLSFARNKGWQVARGDYVGFIDDDCLVPEGWLEKSCDIIKKISPNVFGGPYYAYYNSQKPQWFKDEYESNHFGSSARELKLSEYLTGTNIFFQKSLLEKIGGFQTHLGMIGKHLGFGEETELQQRIRMNYQEALIFYDPDLYVYHLVEVEKMKWAKILPKVFLTGRYAYNIFPDTRDEKLKLFEEKRNVLKEIRVFLKTIIGIFIIIDKNKYPTRQNYIYEEILPYVKRTGGLYQHWVKKHIR